MSAIHSPFTGPLILTRAIVGIRSNQLTELISVQNDVVSVQPDLMGAFAEFLSLDVANEDASTDTIRGYKTQVGQW